MKIPKKRHVPSWRFVAVRAPLRRALRERAVFRQKAFLPRRSICPHRMPMLGGFGRVHPLFFAVPGRRPYRTQALRFGRAEKRCPKNCLNAVLLQGCARRLPPKGPLWDGVMRQAHRYKPQARFQHRPKAIPNNRFGANGRCLRFETFQIQHGLCHRELLHFIRRPTKSAEKADIQLYQGRLQ